MGEIRTLYRPKFILNSIGIQIFWIWSSSVHKGTRQREPKGKNVRKMCGVILPHRTWKKNIRIATLNLTTHCTCQAGQNAFLLQLFYDFMLTFWILVCFLRLIRFFCKNFIRRQSHFIREKSKTNKESIRKLLASLLK